MGTRFTRLAIVTLVAIGGMLPLRAATAGTPSEPVSEPAGMVETLKANPGSVRTGHNTVLLKPGIMVRLPSHNEVGTQSLSQCPVGWLCGWVDTNYRGPMYGIRQNDCVSFGYWWYNRSDGVTVYNDWHGPEGPGWERWANSISSVRNHTSNRWGSFYSYRLRDTLNIRNDAPMAYVGSTWNDSFTSACAKYNP